MKYIVVTGGVMSGIGKGIVSASIGSLLKHSGYRVEIIKCDPYIQMDAGTMSPYEHGECFVTHDGGEVDLDFGHYERFLDQQVMFENSITTGQIYQSVITKERKGDYLGQTVQVVPHIVDEVIQRIQAVGNTLAAQDGDKSVVVIEIGGTVGDIEGPHFYEAVRQLDTSADDVVQFVHVAPLVRHSYNGEVKTKPLQHSIQKLREIGIIPDFVVTRTPSDVTHIPTTKISKLCGIPESHCIHCPDRATIYQVPVDFESQGFDQQIQESFGRSYMPPKFVEWKQRVDVLLDPKKELNICIAGKYTELDECYLSVIEATLHAGVHFNTKTHIHRLDTVAVQEQGEQYIADFFAEHTIQGLIVPGGFGERGVEGMITVAKYCREHKVPYLGICLGLQVAVIEYARNVLGYTDAHSAEFDPTSTHLVIDLMESQQDISHKGGTMRLGHYEAILDPTSKVARAYGHNKVTERHRHRYEVSERYHEELSRIGNFKLSGCSPDRSLVEFVEYTSHPYFVATQAHPEFESAFLDPHPLFREFVRASLGESAPTDRKQSTDTNVDTMTTPTSPRTVPTTAVAATSSVSGSASVSQEESLVESLLDVSKQHNAPKNKHNSIDDAIKKITTPPTYDSIEQKEKRRQLDHQSVEELKTSTLQKNNMTSQQKLADQEKNSYYHRQIQQRQQGNKYPKLGKKNLQHSSFEQKLSGSVVMSPHETSETPTMSSDTDKKIDLDAF